MTQLDPKDPSAHPTNDIDSWRAECLAHFRACDQRWPFDVISKMTKADLLTLSNDELRDLSRTIARIWNFHLYPIDVEIMSLLNERTRLHIDTSSKPDVTNIVREVIKALGTAKIKDLINSQSEGDKSE